MGSNSNCWAELQLPMLLVTNAVAQKRRYFYFHYLSSCFQLPIALSNFLWSLPCNLQFSYPLPIRYFSTSIRIVLRMRLKWKGDGNHFTIVCAKTHYCSFLPRKLCCPVFWKKRQNICLGVLYAGNVTLYSLRKIFTFGKALAKISVCTRSRKMFGTGSSICQYFCL